MGNTYDGGRVALAISFAVVENLRQQVKQSPDEPQWLGK